MHSYAFLSKCDNYDGVAVDLLLIERHAEGKRDRGEAESVVQASERAATLIIDDRWGRELGTRYGLKTIGTLWILQRLHALGIRSADQIRTDLVVLQQRKYRLPKNAVNALLREIGQNPIIFDL